MRHFHHDTSSTKDMSPAAITHFWSSDFKLDTPAPDFTKSLCLEIIIPAYRASERGHLSLGTIILE